MNFKSNLARTALALSIGVAAPCAAGAATITVTPTLAPNAFGSPSYSGWVANSIAALEIGAPTMGDPTSPTYYQAQSNVTNREGIVTSFASWLGQAGPTGAYASELGNRMAFGVFINGDGTQFSISQLSFNATSNDAGDALGFGFGAGSYDYSTQYVGIIAGVGGLSDYADDTFITSGPNTQLVDAVVGRGSGNSFAADCAGCTIAQEQAAINAAANNPGLTQFTGTYTLGDSSGSGTFNITAVPEPATWAMMLVGFGGIGAAMRRSRRNQAVALLS
jgi:hypothetical protein